MGHPVATNEFLSKHYPDMVEQIQASAIVLIMHANSGKEQEILDLAAVHAKPKFADADLTEEEIQSILRAVKDAVVDTAERMRKHAESMDIEIMRMIFVTLKTQDAVMNAIANNVSASLPERYSPKKAEIWH
ncbi:hypothetical protein [Mesorhizobium sp. SP-1A]|uniref:hypothetical protein n=1 Tax=Mesorhizobium sp. SP-1A TaxID=3077840 RepID=UPI0028F71968|nr:hypothetical protein [Mesorhizobium sp. SP-1A]